MTRISVIGAIVGVAAAFVLSVNGASAGDILPTGTPKVPPPKVVPGTGVGKLQPSKPPNPVSATPASTSVAPPPPQSTIK